LYCKKAEMGGVIWAEARVLAPSAKVASENYY
jgi:hypothetical protein